MNRKQNKIDKTTPEIRAYIYQQLSDLEHMIPKGSAIAITVDEDKKEKKYVSIVLKTALGELVVNSQNQDIYEAIQDARHDLEGQLSNFSGMIDEDELREGAVDHLMTHKYLH